MRVIAVVQARLGSTRLPGKVLAEIAGRPMLGHVLDRAQAIHGVDEVILTTPMPEAPELRGLPGVDRWVPHVPPDVLAGFAQAVERSGAKIVMRLTGDNPLIDPDVCTFVLAHFYEATLTLPGVPLRPYYAHNLNPPTAWPEGLDTEVFLASDLIEAHQRAFAPADREHPTRYISRLRPHAVLPDPRAPANEPLLPHHKECSSQRWTVDTEEDLARVRAIYAHLTPGDFSWQATLRAAREAGV